MPEGDDESRPHHNSAADFDGNPVMGPPVRYHNPTSSVAPGLHLGPPAPPAHLQPVPPVSGAPSRSIATSRPARTRPNGATLASLVLGLLSLPGPRLLSGIGGVKWGGFLLPPIGLALGLIGLIRVMRKDGRTRAIAWVAVFLNLIWPVLLVLIVMFLLLSIDGTEMM